VLVRRVTLALLVPALLTAGCSSSGGKSGTPTTSAAASTGSASPTSNAAATALASKMRTGLADLTSAHIDVDAGELGGRSSGDVKYADGRATASHVTIGSGAQATDVVTIGGKTYAKLPPGRNTSGKPWVVVSPTSKNEFVRGLASSLNISNAAASLPAIADVVATASSVQDKGGGHYALSVEPARSKGTTLGALLGDIGQESVPVDLYLDGTGRPTRIVISVKIGSSSFPVTINVSKFDAPVSISAPPADQISA
jgi:hypothetical protein